MFCIYGSILDILISANVIIQYIINIYLNIYFSVYILKYNYSINSRGYLFINLYSFLIILPFLVLYLPYNLFLVLIFIKDSGVYNNLF